MDEDMTVYYNSVLLNLENAAKTNRFATKEEFNKYIEGVKKNGMPDSILSEEKKKELLASYDKFHPVTEAGLDMNNYTGTRLEEQNYIVNRNDDVLLQTDASKDEIPAEFKSVQNELSSANSQDNLANANEVYQEMRNNRKQEVQLISLSEMINRGNASEEMLAKIRFFITRKDINIFQFKIAPETGQFYNTETDEVLEVRKNPETGDFEIVKGSQVVYKDEASTETKEASVDNSEELDSQEQELDKKNVKIRRRLPPKNISDQAAFVKISVLTIVSIFAALFLSMIILVLK